MERDNGAGVVGDRAERTECGGIVGERASGAGIVRRLADDPLDQELVPNDHLRLLVDAEGDEVDEGNGAGKGAGNGTGTGCCIF